MKFATWNVNSLKVRLPQVLDFLEEEAVDALALQETKMTDEAFPAGAFADAEFDAVFTGQKTYNGVALIARRSSLSLEDPVLGIPGYPDPQRRLAAATAVTKGGARIRLVSAYFPNGAEPGRTKYLYKLEWISALADFIAGELARHQALVLAGDMNVAPDDSDVWSPDTWRGGILVSDAERDAFRSLLSLGLRDAYRLKERAATDWTWWDYRGGAFQKNEGLRIDHVLVSEGLASSVKEVFVAKSMRGRPQPSDHAPVVAEFSF